MSLKGRIRLLSVHCASNPQTHRFCHGCPTLHAQPAECQARWVQQCRGRSRVAVSWLHYKRHHYKSVIHISFILPVSRRKRSAMPNLHECLCHPCSEQIPMQCCQFNGAPLCGRLLHFGPVCLLLLSTQLPLPRVGWFEGLSVKFLAARSARLLVLAGTDRLDDELMIGQMQGKFQLVVVPGVGHMIQEVCDFVQLDVI